MEDNVISVIDYTELINQLVDSNNNIKNSLDNINKNLDSISQDAKFLRDYFEVTEQEQQIIDSELKNNEKQLKEEKQKEVDSFLKSINELTSLEDLRLELVELNKSNNLNNNIVTDSSAFLSSAFVILLGLLLSFCIINYIKCIFNKFY